MDEKIAYGRQLIDDAKQRSSQVSEAERKRALIIFNYSNGTARVAGDTPFFGYYWLQTANAKNAAEGTSQGLAPVNAEQILAWDPDAVLIGGAGQANLTVDQVLNNSAEGLDLSGLRAVKDKQVYSNELGMWSWFIPNPDAPLVANWLGKTLYPDEFSDVDLVKQVKEYYKKIYNFDLSDDQAQDILRGSTS
ncbi:ABC transporter substrate-binding protein [Corynebacterium flavescens]|uniref:Fe/B12 periplasmic-binding domain-containing protein n=1 Tax=Corynebacterium flavescens TaxID=28028 RepID=A0A1L7CPA1_CORFL|nr:ABC transporter substrate-binding protein [Corynebacterium flavescens]APT87673.1 hypothetical protein CFLV_11265 [Corynebacterium flavescens]GEB96937.1 hypothetical protein CFL01nite_04320 [Corynebacterium flavescens]